MCGFFFSRNDMKIDLDDLLKKMIHRGPDSTKKIKLKNVLCGFNRLSIINQSSDSDQPMCDSSGRYVILFNGEIYNHSDLKKKLLKKHKINFRTNSDTEVILNLLIYEGLDYVKNLDGIFSIVFYDSKLDSISLIRDFIGVKPIYFYNNDKKIYISSEIRPINSIINSKISNKGCSEYLTLGVSMENNTILENIKKVNPGEIIKFDKNNSVSSKKFFSSEFNKTKNYKINQIENLLSRSIKSQIPNIKFGVMFSGGIDSSLLLAKTYKMTNFQSSFSVNIEDRNFSEFQYQKLVIKKFNLSKKSSFLNQRKEDFSIKNLKKVARRYDLPVIHPNFIGALKLTKEASRSGLKVLLSGEGADEIFMGYKWFLEENKKENFLEYIKYSDLEKIIPSLGNLPINKNKMSIEKKFQEIYLQKWLTRQDLSGMANGIEIRVPFLSLSLLKYLNKIVFKEKIKNNITKFMLKKIAENYFDEKFVYRKKMGFDYPLNKWINSEHINFLKGHKNIIDVKQLNKLWLNNNSYFIPRLIFVTVMYVLWIKENKVIL